MKAALLCLFASCLIASVSAQVTGAVPFTHSAYADNLQEVGAESSYALGAALFVYDPTTKILNVSVVHSVDGAISQHIHGPALPGNAADIVFSFSDGTSPNEGSWTLSAQQESDLLSGLYYWNVHSTDFPDGEIRGQVLQCTQAVTVLTPQAEVDPPVTDNEGDGWALVSVGATSGSDITLSVTIVTNISSSYNLSASHIHGPANTSVSGPVIVPLSISPLPVQGSGPVDADEFAEGLLYLNLHSLQDEDGYARGQIIPPVNAGAILTPITGVANTDSLGIFLAVASSDGILVSIIHNLDNPTNLTIYDVPVPLKSFASPIEFPVPAENAALLVQYLGLVPIAVTISTEEYPEGEISGSINKVNPVIVAAATTTSSSSSSTATSAATTTSTASTASTSTSSSTTNGASSVAAPSILILSALALVAAF